MGPTSCMYWLIAMLRLMAGVGRLHGLVRRNARPGGAAVHSRGQFVKFELAALQLVDTS